MLQALDAQMHLYVSTSALVTYSINCSGIRRGSSALPRLLRCCGTHACLLIGTGSAKLIKVPIANTATDRHVCWDLSILFHVDILSQIPFFFRKWERTGLEHHYECDLCETPQSRYSERNNKSAKGLGL